MRLLTHREWEHFEWEKGEPLPDVHTASLMFLHADDFVPNINRKKVKHLLQLVEDPINDALQENDNADENDRWRLSGLMFQKTTMVDDDPDNTSLAGTSSELCVVNEESDENDYELPLVFRKWIPMNRLKEIMDASGVTGENRIPDEVMGVCDILDIGVGTQMLMTQETCNILHGMTYEGLTGGASQDIEMTT